MVNEQISPNLGAIKIYLEKHMADKLTYMLTFFQFKP